MAAILITGSDGQLGNELRSIAGNYYGYDFVFTDVRELDLADALAVKQFITDLGPDWIINCAAWNFVDRAETEKDAAMLVNSTAVRNITDSIAGTSCKFIHISSDYVYDGSGCVPYNETAVPDPQSVYGRSKLEGERAALDHPASMVIRTSWLYSGFGNNFVKTMLRLGREKETLSVVFDQTGTPTWAADLASAIMQIVSGSIRHQKPFVAGIYNYSNEGACTWYDFATEIMLVSGLSCSVKPVLSSEFRQAARRPSYSVMDKTKIRETYGIEIPHWRQSLIRCMKTMNY